MWIWLTSKQWTAWRITTWWKRTNEGLRGARSVSPCFTLFCEFPWRWCCCLVLVLFGCVLFGCLFATREFLPELAFSHIQIPVVDRQCLVLARQCKKKKTRPHSGPKEWQPNVVWCYCGGVVLLWWCGVIVVVF